MSAAIDHGYLPSGRYIINHDIMNCTAEGVVGNHLYSGRALGLSEPWDMIQLHPDLQPLWDDVSAHYDRIGLRHAKKVVWHVHRAELGEHIGYHPSVFFFGPHECCYWGDHQWMETVDFINSKNNFMASAEELGIPVPVTKCYGDVVEIDETEIRQLGFPCYLRPRYPCPVSASIAVPTRRSCERLWDFSGPAFRSRSRPRSSATASSTSSTR